MRSSALYKSFRGMRANQTISVPISISSPPKSRHGPTTVPRRRLQCSPGLRNGSAGNTLGFPLSDGPRMPSAKSKAPNPARLTGKRGNGCSRIHIPKTTTKPGIRNASRRSTGNGSRAMHRSRFLSARAISERPTRSHGGTRPRAICRMRYASMVSDAILTEAFGALGHGAAAGIRFARACIGKRIQSLSRFARSTESVPRPQNMHPACMRRSTGKANRFRFQPPTGRARAWPVFLCPWASRPARDHPSLVKAIPALAFGAGALSFFPFPHPQSASRVSIILPVPG